MKKRYLQLTGKIIAFILCFAIVFLFLNAVFSDLYATRARCFDRMEDNSIDAIFLGASQMFSGVNAQKITEEYGISSLDFGSDMQPMMTTCYYLQEALKRQKPKVVGVEVCEIFNDSITVERLVYNYSAMPLTSEKYNSLQTVLDGDKLRAVKYCVPLIANHSWWNQINPIETLRDLFFYNSAECAERGFLYRYTVEPQEIEYLGEKDGNIREIPDHSKDAINYIADLCRQNDIKLVFFKLPVARDWTRNDSKTVKEYMSENGFTFFDMNDNFGEIGIDPETDFHNGSHLNTPGANKTTDYFVQKLKSLEVF